MAKAERHMRDLREISAPDRTRPIDLTQSVMDFANRYRAGQLRANEKVDSIIRSIPEPKRVSDRER